MPHRSDHQSSHGNNQRSDHPVRHRAGTAAAVVTLCGLLSWPALGSTDTAALPTGGPTLDPQRVGWSRVNMSASKLFLSARATLTLRLLPAAAIQDDLFTVPAGHPVQPGPRVLELVYEAGGAGRRSVVTLFMDPVTGAAIQREQHDMQGRFRHRTYRYTDVGAYHRTRWPLEGEESKPVAEWSRTEEGLRAYAAGPVPVIEPTGLLYVTSAAPLFEPGDALELTLFRSRRLQRVRVTVVNADDIAVQYEETATDGTRTGRRGRLKPLRLSLTAIPEPGADEEEELQLLGLRGDLTLDLEPASRAPLQLSGRVKLLGQVTLRLNSVVLR